MRTPEPLRAAGGVGRRSRRAVLGYGLLVAALALWAGLQPWGSDPLDTSHALPSLALGLAALPSVVPLIVLGVGAEVGRTAFLVLVVALAVAEAAALRWALLRLRAPRAARGAARSRP
ncbi:hypothetical protein ACFW1A_29495 [Kitasatospora sp. NPDC058965]|uniref:hypothetical protein n=1 Tax=Kitasatospora sp. NPDC058965 TaxID=3346682 RepID=UPI00367B2B78